MAANARARSDRADMSRHALRAPLDMAASARACMAGLGQLTKAKISPETAKQPSDKQAETC